MARVHWEMRVTGIVADVIARDLEQEANKIMNGLERLGLEVRGHGCNVVFDEASGVIVSENVGEQLAVGPSEPAAAPMAETE